MRLTVYSADSGGIGASLDGRESLITAVRLAEAHLDAEASDWVESWDKVRRMTTGADCLVIVAPQVTQRDVSRIESLSSPSLVVVTEDPFRAAHRLRRVVVQEITSADPAEIVSAIRRIEDNAVLERAARIAEQHPKLSPRFRTWLSRTMRKRPPFRSVGESTEGLDISPATIRRYWATQIGVSRPKMLTSWIQLAYAVALKNRETTWQCVAGQLGIALRTLERVAQRLAGCRLVDLRTEHVRFERELERFLATLLSGDRLQS